MYFLAILLPMHHHVIVIELGFCAKLLRIPHSGYGISRGWSSFDNLTVFYCVFLRKKHEIRYAMP